MAKSNKPKPAPSTDAPSNSDARLLIITPGSNTVQPSIFHVTDSKTGEVVGQKHCFGPLFAKGDITAEYETEFTEKYGTFELKFINETKITLDELVSLNAEFEGQETPETTTINEDRLSEDLVKAQLADDEQSEKADESNNYEPTSEKTDESNEEL